MDNKGSSLDPKRKMCYIDEQGAITFNVGACVNSFKLDQPIKFLISSKIMKLFKLFKDNDKVKFKLGYDNVNGEVVAKASFENKSICLTTVLSSDNLKVGVPVQAIRGLVNNSYAYSINIDRVKLLEAIDRLSLLVDDGIECQFDFDEEFVKMSDKQGNNSEIIKYENSKIDATYSARLDLGILKATLEGCVEQYLTMYFGDGRAVVVSRGNVKNVIPEASKK